jgi:hypothetical protein
MANTVYLLCALTSGTCALLLFRLFWQAGTEVIRVGQAAEIRTRRSICIWIARTASSVDSGCRRGTCVPRVYSSGRQTRQREASSSSSLNGRPINGKTPSTRTRQLDRMSPGGRPRHIQDGRKGPRSSRDKPKGSGEGQGIVGHEDRECLRQAVRGKTKDASLLRRSIDKPAYCTSA